MIEYFKFWVMKGFVETCAGFLILAAIFNIIIIVAFGVDTYRMFKRAWRKNGKN